MILGDIPRGASLFIDANTFVYYFSPHAQFDRPCTELLQRIQRQEIAATTTVDVLSDVAHRMMTIEAMTQQAWPAGGIAQRLRKHPQVIQSLTLFRRALVHRNPAANSCGRAAPVLHFIVQPGRQTRAAF